MSLATKREPASGQESSSTAVKRRIRVAFVTIMPSPYVEDMFATLASDPQIDLSVFYMEMEAHDTHWGQRPLPSYAKLLAGRWHWILGGRVHDNPQVIREVKAAKPDVVVAVGYSSLTNQRLFRWLHRESIPWVFWGELPGIRPRGVAKRFLRWLAIRPTVKWPSAIAAIGVRALREYRRLSAGRIPVVNLPYVCDLDPFLAIERDPERPERDGVHFLYCGQLIERKGVDLLVDAFCQIAAQDARCRLTLVGEGALRDDLVNQIPKSIRSRIDFAGFQPVAELPHWFAATDVFVLPSRHDGWGVVINQAVAAGMPVLCSDAVGAGFDLVDDGNGARVQAGDAPLLAAAMNRFVGDARSIRLRGIESRARSNGVQPAAVAQQWRELLTRVVAANLKTAQS